MNTNIELSLLDPEEKELLNYIWNLIPEADRQGMTQADVLLVLDLMDDYLVENGLLEEDDQAGEMTYLDGEIDETEQLNFLVNATKEQGLALSSTQIQLIMDGELQYGIEKGYYQEEE
ncbi:MAG: hypothetical protein IJV81_00160 [Paludibacteraceae bacterium]|nr:hypothetical protein [Paludibacteraceae bacterium]